MPLRTLSAGVGLIRPQGESRRPMPQTDIAIFRTEWSKNLRNSSGNGGSPRGRRLCCLCAEPRSTRAAESGDYSLALTQINVPRIGLKFRLLSVQYSIIKVRGEIDHDCRSHRTDWPWRHNSNYHCSACPEHHQSSVPVGVRPAPLECWLESRLEWGCLRLDVVGLAVLTEV